MPMYEYSCDCGQIHEIYRSYDEFVEDIWDVCPQTHRYQTMKVVLQPPVFHLKGYGFYSTDRRSRDEKYAFDHFDGSGTNAEMRAMDRRIKDPESTIPKKPEKTWL